MIGKQGCLHLWFVWLVHHLSKWVVLMLYSTWMDCRYKVPNKLENGPCKLIFETPHSDSNCCFEAWIEIIPRNVYGTWCIVYIWSTTRHHNIIWIKSHVKLKIAIDLSRIFGQKICTKNAQFLSSNPENHVFHKNLDVIFLKYLDVCVRNTLLVDNTAYKSLFVWAI